MSSLLPCCRLVSKKALSSKVAAASLQLKANYTTVSTCSLRRSKTTAILSQRRQFTLPDLSKLSPFGSTSSSGKDGSNDDKYHERVTMPFHKEVLFNIVSDVDQYASFVPYCVESKVKPSSEKQINENTKEFLAELAIGYGQFKESYTSKVTIIDGKSVQATAIPTPLFQRLETEWIFKELSSQSTQVDFTIHYSFSNPIYAAFAKTAMEKMTAKMVEAFKQRAEQQQ